MDTYVQCGWWLVVVVVYLYISAPTSQRAKGKRPRAHESSDEEEEDGEEEEDEEQVGMGGVFVGHAIAFCEAVHCSIPLLHYWFTMLHCIVPTTPLTAYATHTQICTGFTCQICTGFTC